MYLYTQYCAQLDGIACRLLLSRILAVVANSTVLHRTKSSACIAHYIRDGNLLIRSLMNTKNRVGDSTSIYIYIYSSLHHN